MTESDSFKARYGDGKGDRGKIRKKDHSFDFADFMQRPSDEDGKPDAAKILRSFAPRVPVKPAQPVEEKYFTDDEAKGLFMYGKQKVDVSKFPFDPIIPGGGTTFNKANVTSIGKALEERVLDCKRLVEQTIGKVFTAAKFEGSYWGATEVKVSPIGDKAGVEALAISDWSFKGLDYSALTMIIEGKSMRAVYQVSNGAGVIAYGIVATKRDGKLVLHEIKQLGV